MAHFIIQSCSGCAVCASRCPVVAIHGERGAPHLIVASRCIDCGACGVACRSEAIFDERGARIRFLLRSERPLAFVDARACSACGWCVACCPSGSLSFDQDPAPGACSAPLRVNDARCSGCRICENACPNGAITVRRRDQAPESLPPAVAA
jgi:electron transport complex protein RnfB